MKLDRINITAMAGAFLMVAHQVSGKAVRDSFFLSNFAATDLPKMIMTAATTTIVMVLLVSRLMRRYGPWLLIPAGFLLSSLLHVLEFFCFAKAPGAWTVVIYLHGLAIGSILLSGFWSLMSELFDPRSAKEAFARIGSVGTVGGIVGAVLTERMAAVNATSGVLLLLAGFHALCSVLVFSCTRNSKRSRERMEESTISPVKLLRAAPHLGMLALLVLAGTSSAAILDYLFKAGAGATLGKGAQLLRFLAIFYLFTLIIGFLFQTFLTTRLLKRFGLGKTVSLLPLGVGAGALAGMVIPVFPMFALIRGLESTLRGSAFRSAYETFYTPVRPAEKRSAKTLIDVAVDRAGDALGGGIVQLLLLFNSEPITSQFLAIVLGLAATGVWIALRLDAIYSRLVQQRLVDKAVEFDITSIEDSTTHRAIQAVRPETKSTENAIARPQPAHEDALLDILRELRSRDSSRVHAALNGIHAPSPLIAAQLIQLLAWDDVASAVQEVLKRDPRRIAGLLVDHLVHRSVEFGIRRRIPGILASSESMLAVQGLIAGLEDQRFEVRFRCARALDSIVMRRPDLKPKPEAVFDAIRRELQVSRVIWNSRRLLENRADKDQFTYFDGEIRGRSNKSLECIFSLLAAVLPREPVIIAFRALHTDDSTFRNLAFEFLDGILPADIRKPLWEMAEPGVAKLEPSSPSSGESTIQELLCSSDSIASLIASKYGPS